MLYRLSYERIFSDLQILPNNITTPAPKKQEESAKKCLSKNSIVKCNNFLLIFLYILSHHNKAVNIHSFVGSLL